MGFLKFTPEDFESKMKKAKVYLPAEYFVDFDDKEEVKSAKSKLITHKGKMFYLVDNESIEQYSFKSNQIKFDSDWYGDFVIEF